MPTRTQSRPVVTTPTPLAVAERATAPAAQSLPEPAPKAKGWSPTGKVSRPPPAVTERAPSAMTYSELLRGFDGLRGAASGDVEVKRFNALVKATESLRIQPPFLPAYEKARAAAASRLGLQGFEAPNVLEKLFGSKPAMKGSLPLPAGAVPFDPKQKGPFGSNHVLTAALSAVVYEDSKFNYDTSKTSARCTTTSRSSASRSRASPMA